MMPSYCEGGSTIRVRWTRKTRAVRFERFGDVDVLRLFEVPAPVPQAGEVPVRVLAAGTKGLHDADRELARRHARGKIVFDPSMAADAEPERRGA